MTALIKITDHKRMNSICIIFSAKALKMIDSKEIVIIKKTEGLKIRRPTLDSKKTFQLNKSSSISYSFEGSKDLIGDYYITDENMDEFELNKIH